jgi:hypothetical protein
MSGKKASNHPGLRPVKGQQQYEGPRSTLEPVSECREVAVQIMQLLITQFYPLPSYPLHLLNTKYSCVTTAQPGAETNSGS